MVAADVSAERHDDRLLRRSARLIARSVGVPPALRWRHAGTPRMEIEYYVYVPPSIQVFPHLPLHTMTCLLDGKTVHNASVSRGVRPEVQERFATIPNRCVVVPRNITSYWRPGSGSISMATVYIAGEGQDALEALLHGSQQPILLHDALVASLIRQLLRTAREDPSGASEYVARLVGTFVAHLRWLAHSGDAAQRSRSTLSDPAISRALAEIDRHLDESITIARLSTLSKMSEALFRRRFKEITGSSVHRYIRMQRVQRAREMIEETNLALAAIATHCGFSSQSHMTAVYRQALGITPGGQRRR